MIKILKILKKLKKILYFAKADVTKKKNLENLRNKLKKIFKIIDVVIFAPTYKSKDFYFPFDKLSLSSWKKIIEVELTGAFLVSQIFGKTFEDQKKGNLIFLSSIYGIVGNDHSIYAGSNLAQVYQIKNKKKKFFLILRIRRQKAGL